MKSTVALSLLFFTPLLSWSQSGVIDSSFANQGISVHQLTPLGDEGVYCDIQSNGKIIVATRHITGVETWDGGITRYFPNGVLDSTFGIDGICSLGISNQELASDVKISQDENWIYLAGSIDKSGSNLDCFVARFDTTGILDQSFGAAGIASCHIDFFDWPPSMLIQPDGKILLTGFSYGQAIPDPFVGYAVRFLTTGALDPNFGNGGIVTFAPQNMGFQAHGAALGNSGDIYVAGTPYDSSNYVGVVKILSSGEVDTTFGEMGFGIAFNPDTGYHQGWDVIEINGRLIVSGEIGSIPYTYPCLTGFHLNTGAPDSSFGENGFVVPDLSGKMLGVYGNFLKQPDGKFLALGNIRWSLDEDFILSRYLADGSPDLSFGIDGHLESDYSDIAFAPGFVFDEQNDIYVSGTLSDSLTNDRKIFLSKVLNSFNVGLLELDKETRIQSLYPNPIESQAILKFSLEKEEELSLFLLDQNGGKIRDFQSSQAYTKGDHEVSLNFQALTPGWYRLIIDSGDGQQGISVIKK